MTNGGFHPFTLSDLVNEALSEGVSLGEIALRHECEFSGISRLEAVRRMQANLDVMRSAVQQGLSGRLRSAGGLVGGDAAKVEEYKSRGLSGDHILSAASRALAVSEVNASMGLIVASPTAGSCGVIPGVLLTVAERVGADDEATVMALFAAGAVGIVAASRAGISGAEGGCQAECGVAAAMAAASAVQLAGGDPEAAAHAAAMSLKALLGLVCDPVAGLVEVPCVKRNAFSAAIAMIAADMALAGVRSVIPPDEVIDAMGAVGRMLPVALRETAEGGLAATPTGKSLSARICHNLGDLSGITIGREERGDSGKTREPEGLS
ncbi:MAG TPA: L-serine ammonia-lyase, iron-sulfur-dependent, subunit alpha [Clostridia bacterium]|nr:L-serine ammonia-lyase, iron-sulfur-dependent, subunit alpha [Clostridia bacterium]